MASNALSDTELREALEALGCHVGPVTATTRKLYEKKLVKLRNSSSISHQQQSQEITTSQTSASATPQNKTQTRKVVDTSTGEDWSNTTPRHYTPDGSDLKRRPLYTSPGPPSPSTTTTTTRRIVQSTKSKYPSSDVKSRPAQTTKKSSWSCSRVVFLVVVVLFLLTLLVYYHMEDSLIKQLF